MKAVIYARYSSDNQREESIEGQLRECMAFAERKGYTVIKSYADRAISGKRADNRPEFQRMINDSAKGEFDVVIVWKIDRFSRDKYDSVIYKSKLNKNGVSVISATEPIDDSPEGKLMESIFEGFSEYYVKDLELKTSRGMTENAIKGKFNGGHITYGYVIDDDKRFQKHETEAPIVAEIFRRYAEGEPIRSIIDDLTSKSVTNRGKKMTYHFINWILKNRRYIGEYTFRDTMNTEAIPPIISEEIFEKCQKRLSSNKHKAASFKKVEERYYLTGKIFCGECGTSMSGISGTSKTKDNYRYYQCMKSKKKTCKKKIVQKALIEDKVFDSIMLLLKNKNLVKKISERCYSMQSAESSQVPILKKQLKAVEKEIDNVMNAIKAGIITKSTKATLTDLEEKQAAIEAALAQEQICRPILSREQIEFWIMQFAKTDFKDEIQKQRLIDIFINSVFVYEDRIVVFLNFKEGEVAISLAEATEGIKKENTQDNLECSSSFKFGDPYGSRNDIPTFLNLR